MNGFGTGKEAAGGATLAISSPSIAETIRASAAVLPGGGIEIGALHRKIDCTMLNEGADLLAERFRPQAPNVVLTPELSGIALGALVAAKLSAHLIVARKEIGLQEAVIWRSAFCSRRHATRELRIYRSDLSPGDRVLIVDDMMRRGDAVAALAEIAREAGARLVGVGIMVELRCDARPRLGSANINAADIVPIVRLSLNGKQLGVA